MFKNLQHHLWCSSLRIVFMKWLNFTVSGLWEIVILSRKLRFMLEAKNWHRQKNVISFTSSLCSLFLSYPISVSYLICIYNCIHAIPSIYFLFFLTLHNIFQHYLVYNVTRKYPSNSYYLSFKHDFPTPQYEYFWHSSINLKLQTLQFL